MRFKKYLQTDTQSSFYNMLIFPYKIRKVGKKMSPYHQYSISVGLLA
jgi:hypothetical protein